ncbi:SixA phosphatase family protein [Angustibacter luteus]|uniref:SixA phosphatase family protein n=1 Tax=Angustibacter luteus TaxID=658456 RepID=A0ABW1JAS0_9ACTN
MTAERQLLVVRHAKSDQNAGVADHERPLNDRGRRDAPALGRWLTEHGLRPDLVLCSSAERARQTWELAAAELDDAPPVDVRDALYETSASGVLTQLREVDDHVRVVAVVGHEPTQSAVASALAGSADPRAEQALREGFTTSGVAVLELAGPWRELAPGSCRLTAFAAPRG